MTKRTPLWALMVALIVAAILLEDVGMRRCMADKDESTEEEIITEADNLKDKTEKTASSWADWARRKMNEMKDTGGENEGSTEENKSATKSFPAGDGTTNEVYGDSMGMENMNEKTKAGYDKVKEKMSPDEMKKMAGDVKDKTIDSFKDGYNKVNKKMSPDDMKQMPKDMKDKIIGSANEGYDKVNDKISLDAMKMSITGGNMKKTTSGVNYGIMESATEGCDDKGNDKMSTDEMKKMAGDLKDKTKDSVKEGYNKVNEKMSPNEMKDMSKNVKDKVTDSANKGYDKVKMSQEDMKKMPSNVKDMVKDSTKTGYDKVKQATEDGKNKVYNSDKEL